MHNIGYIEKKTMSGTGILSNIKQKHINKLKSRPNNVDNFIKTKGNLRIKRFAVCREPINPAIKTLVNLVSENKVNDAMKKYNYDKLFHLYLTFTLENDEHYLIEKNEIVYIIFRPNRKPNTEIKPGRINIVFKDMIEKAERSDPNLYYYSAQDNNCQKFIRTLVHSMGFHNYDNFIMQYHMNKIITNNTKKTAHFFTTFAASFKRYILGKGKE